MKQPLTSLATKRLLLRQPAPADLPTYEAYCASPRSHFVGGPFDAPKAFEKFAAMAGHWALRGFGRYIITHNDHAIGHVGPLQIDTSCAPEFTWTLWDSASEGQGLATEAAMAVQDHLFRECHWQQMIIRIMPANTASRRIAERIGARLSDDPAPAWYPGALTYHLTAEVPA